MSRYKLVGLKVGQVLTIEYLHTSLGEIVGARENPLTMFESYWDRFNKRLREEGLTQQFEVREEVYSYPVPRNEEEARIFLKIASEPYENPSYDTWE